ncbi:MOSC domain-containing protein [Nocardioides baekrokdamisoli]|uniref:MOSC domain-containing protein n=1 Tax=Nocardioides baekrokdamisoli TaxID=1804624 RepID=UPI000F7A2675|nr:MOSC domain-containing protein [Nocardioides baekrokdamisoli]
MKVIAIHTAPGVRLPMVARSSVLAEAGVGLVGDRYHGTKHRHVTIQAQDALDEGAVELGRTFAPELTRRNITVDVGPIPRVPGDRLRIGDVELEVVRIAAPCRLLDDTIGPGAARALSRRAGTIFRILSSGEIRVGDEVRVSTLTDVGSRTDRCRVSAGVRRSRGAGRRCRHSG